MALTESKKRANKKWNDAHPYARITFLLNNEEKEKIYKAAAAAGESVSEYSKKAVFSRMERETEK